MMMRKVGYMPGMDLSKIGNGIFEFLDFKTQLTREKDFLRALKGP